MFTKELAIPLIFFIVSIALKTCSLLFLCSLHPDKQEHAQSDDEHPHDETSIILSSLRLKKIRNNFCN